MTIETLTAELDKRYIQAIEDLRKANGFSRTDLLYELSMMAQKNAHDRASLYETFEKELIASQ